MKNTIDLEEAFNIRDQYCCLQLLTSIVTSGNLQDETSSIYSSLSGHKILQQILQNMYYIPNSIIDYKESEVLANLLIENSKGNLNKFSVDSSKAIMSDEYAEMLVEQSGDESNSTQLISLTIGEAAYRCAFSELNKPCDLSRISYADNISLPNVEQSNSITLAMLIISNNVDLRASINSITDEGELAHLIGNINVGDNFQKINTEESERLARLILANDISALVNFVGQTMHHVTW